MRPVPPSRVRGSRDMAVPMITRRQALAVLALAAGGRALSARAAEQLSVEASEGRIALSRYASERTGKRPAVLLLHGSRGFDLRLVAYERHANALAASGIDAYLVRYYTPADAHAIETMHTSASREAYEAGRFEAWASRVSSVLTGVLGRAENSGRIGLLGFSLGGFVAAATAARDTRVAALAVLYGGMPEKIAAGVKHLPPLLELHGEADRNVPLANGEQLVRLGKAHGFDFADNDPATADAIGRISHFFQARLNTV